MAEFSFDAEFDNSSLDKNQSYLDDSNVIRFTQRALSSSNFDGYLPTEFGLLSASFIKPGMSILLTSSATSGNYKQVISVSKDDPELEETASDTVTINYLDEYNSVKTAVFDYDDQIFTSYEDWENKSLGTTGWTLTHGGNAIFSNVGVRGEVQATSGAILGDLTLGGSFTASTNNGVLILSASGINARGGSNSLVFNSNTGNLFITGNINATSGSFTGVITASFGRIGGFSLGDTGGTAAIKSSNDRIILRSDGTIILSGATGDPLYLTGSIPGWRIFSGTNGPTARFSVDEFGGLKAVSASIIGGLYGASVSGGIITGGTINSSVLNSATGNFTGTVNATSGSFSGIITASIGRIAGFTLGLDVDGSTRAFKSNNGYLVIREDGTIRLDRNGEGELGISTNYIGYRMWVGTSFPPAAPFSINSTGALKTVSSSAINILITGSVTHNGNLYTSGSVFFPQTYNTTVTSPRDLQVDSAGKLGYVSSSFKVKKDIIPLRINDSIDIPAEKLGTRNDLDFNYMNVLNLVPVQFTWESGDQKELGFISEQILEIMPIAAIDEEIPSYHSRMIIPALLAVIKEHQEVIDDLKDRVLQLESQLGG